MTLLSDGLGRILDVQNALGCCLCSATDLRARVSIRAVLIPDLPNALCLVIHLLFCLLEAFLSSDWSKHFGERPRWETNGSRILLKFCLRGAPLTIHPVNAD